jgi:hypothetical protein
LFATQGPTVYFSKGHLVDSNILANALLGPFYALETYRNNEWQEELTSRPLEGQAIRYVLIQEGL